MGVLKVNVDGQWIEISQTGPPGPEGPSNPSANPGNDITKGSDSLLFFDHDTKYSNHIPRFATTAERDLAIPTPFVGQLVNVNGIIYEWTMGSDSYTTWLPNQGGLPRFSVRAASAMTVGADNTWVHVTGYTTVLLDTHHGYNVTAQAYYAPRTGTISVQSTMALSLGAQLPNTWCDVLCGVFRNTTEEIRGDRGAQYSPGDSTYTCVGSILVNAGDLIKPAIYVNALNIGKTANPAPSGLSGRFEGQYVL